MKPRPGATLEFALSGVWVLRIRAKFAAAALARLLTVHLRPAMIPRVLGIMSREDPEHGIQRAEEAH